MDEITTPPPSQLNLATLHTKFLAILPRIELHGLVYFRHLKCSHRKEDAISEMVALCWKWHVRLAERGKDASEFPSALASFAARAVASGRRLVGQEKPKDVLSPLAQKRYEFVVSSLPTGSSLNGNIFDVDQPYCFLC